VMYVAFRPRSTGNQRFVFRYKDHVHMVQRKYL
jgi:hypothetical protein